VPAVVQLPGLQDRISLAQPMAPTATASLRREWLLRPADPDHAEALLALTPHWDLQVRVWALASAPGSEHPRLTALHRLAQGSADGLRAWGTLVAQELHSGDRRPDRLAEAEQIALILAGRTPDQPLLGRLWFSLGLVANHVGSEDLGVPFETTSAVAPDWGAVAARSLAADRPALALVAARAQAAQTGETDLWRRTALAAGCITTNTHIP
jgi:hypothetical protein